MPKQIAPEEIFDSEDFKNLSPEEKAKIEKRLPLVLPNLSSVNAIAAEPGVKEIHYDVKQALAALNDPEMEWDFDLSKEDPLKFDFERLSKIPAAFHKEIAFKLIEAGEGTSVAIILDSFHGLNHREIALKLIEAGNVPALAFNLRKFRGLNHRKIALKLIEAGEGSNVAHNLVNFHGLNHQEIALKLIEAGQGWAVAQNLRKFHGLNQEIALKLIEKEPMLVAQNLDKFQGLNQEVVLKLIEAGQYYEVAKNLEDFHGLSHQEIALKLIKTGHSHAVAFYLDKFQNLNQEIALKLIKKAEGSVVAENLEEFHGLNHQEIALKIIEAGQGQAVAKNLKKFHDLNHQEIALKIIEAGQGEAVAQNLGKFHGLNQEIALKLIEKEPMLVAQNLDKFQGLNQEIVLKLIEAGQGHVVVENLEGFQRLNQEVAIQLAGAGYINEIFDAGKQFWQGGAESSEKWVKGLDFIFDESVPLKIREAKETLKLLAVGDDVDRDELLARQNTGLAPIDMHYLRENHPDQLEKNAEGKYQLGEKSYEALLANWSSDDPMVLENLENGGETFGGPTMIRYMNRVDLSRHDAVYFFPQLFRFLEMNEMYEMDAKAFGKIVLAQVAKDNAGYSEGTAHHHFASIVQALTNVNIGSLLARAGVHAGKFKNLDKLLEDLGKSAEFSWKKLQKVKQLFDLMAEQELLKELVEEKNPKMREYVQLLGFHPNISMEAVFQFWKNPAEFLEIDDMHAPEQIQAVKKPSNYLSEPYLGLNAEDLRDALVGRVDEKLSVMDKLQTLPTFSREYKVADNPQEDVQNPAILSEYFAKAIGKSGRGGGEKVAPLAKNAKKIYQRIEQILKEAAGVNESSAELKGEKLLPPTFAELRDKKESWVVLKEKFSEVYERIVQVIFDQEFGMTEPESLSTYRIMIGAKSDPEMVVAGNDTASCMPFGSGKNNVYMFNPNCAQLVMQRQTAGGVWRTAAQSVLTINQEISQAVPELRKNVFEENAKAEDLINTEDFAKAKVIACDNIEIAKNSEGERSRVIGSVYRNFFREYLKEYGDKLGVSKDKVVVGMGYTPTDLGYKSEPNKTVPLVPVSYSDNLHEESMVIETGLKKSEPTKQSNKIRPIEVTDVYALAHLESKVFKDTNMGYGIHKVQNNLLGIKIANLYFGRPDFTMISKEEGKPAAAYLIAYEGVIGGEKVVYIDDMAAERIGHPAAGRMVLGFFDKYLRAYAGGSDPMPPIYTNARESTSYKLIKAQVERLAKKENLKSEIVEVSKNQSGVDTMHNVMILIARNEQELLELKERAGQMADNLGEDL